MANILGLPSVFGYVFGQSKSTLTPAQAYAAYIASLGGVLLYNGTLTADGTKIANLGTAGAALDGTPTDIAIDANGMNFNGATSVVAAPVSVLISDLPAYTYIFIGRAINEGEGGGGRLWNWANLVTSGIVGATGTINLAIARATTAATANFTNFLSYPSPRFMVIMGWDGTTITGHAAKQGDSAYTLSTGGNGSGALTGLTGAILHIGNRQAGDRAYNGSGESFAVINKPLNDDERAAIAAFAGFF